MTDPVTPAISESVQLRHRLAGLFDLWPLAMIGFAGLATLAWILALA